MTLVSRLKNKIEMEEFVVTNVDKAQLEEKVPELSIKALSERNVNFHYGLIYNGSFMIPDLDVYFPSCPKNSHGAGVLSRLVQPYT